MALYHDTFAWAGRNNLAHSVTGVYGGVIEEVTQELHPLKCFSTFYEANSSKSNAHHK